MKKWLVLSAAVTTAVLLIVSAVGCREQGTPEPTSPTTTTPVPAPNPAPTPTPTPEPTPEPSTPVEGTAIGNLAPNFEFNNAHEQTVSLADFQGKPILLNFWATWCSPCRAELPYIQKVYDTWSEHGLVVLAVNMGESPSKVEEFMKSHNFSFPVLLDSKRSLADKYNIRYIPTTYFIDGNGVIKNIKVGAFSGVAEIEDMGNNILP